MVPKSAALALETPAVAATIEIINLQTVFTKASIMVKTMCIIWVKQGFSDAIEQHAQQHPGHRMAQS
ncbi:hypothetical protein [Devosia sp.]|uniref:hypothetical protein n=1 Tax=Devosia sp. TaxID=1871048 RepID=UPI00273548C0|nr:hypothetical protein [Devosia sp.]MDP2782896.1 hypothetical protein [Devosia sp.]